MREIEDDSKPIEQGMGLAHAQGSSSGKSLAKGGEFSSEKIAMTQGKKPAARVTPASWRLEGNYE